MAARPWITPQDVIEYTEHKEVAERSEERLKVDIMRAEAKIIKITHNKFDDEKYPVIPEQVKLAMILVTEAYAKNSIEATKKNIKSETFDDYSYTVEQSDIDIGNLDLDELLSDFIVSDSGGNVRMHLWKL